MFCMSRVFFFFFLLAVPVSSMLLRGDPKKKAAKKGAAKGKGKEAEKKGPKCEKEGECWKKVCDLKAKIPEDAASAKFLPAIQELAKQVKQCKAEDGKKATEKANKEYESKDLSKPL